VKVYISLNVVARYWHCYWSVATSTAACTSAKGRRFEHNL